MSVKVIVLIRDHDDPKHGELSVLDDERKAERLVETLLEAGFDQERIRVFSGAELEMQVSHRPVVALVGDEPPALKSTARGEEEGVEEEREAAPLHQEDEEGQEEEAPVTAYTQNGVRFSSLFKSA